MIFCHFLGIFLNSFQEFTNFSYISLHSKMLLPFCIQYLSHPLYLYLIPCISLTLCVPLATYTLVPHTTHTSCTHVCLKMIGYTLAPFQIHNFIQSLYCKLSLLFINVPKVPLAHVPEMSVISTSMTKLTLKEPSESKSNPKG